MKKAFTLIEMVIVIILLGILAAIVVPSQSEYISTAKDTSRDVSIRAMQNMRALVEAKIAQEGAVTQTASINGTDTSVTLNGSTATNNCAAIFIILSGIEDSKLNMQAGAVTATATNAQKWTVQNGATGTCRYNPPGYSSGDTYLEYDQAANTLTTTT